MMSTRTVTALALTGCFALVSGGCGGSVTSSPAQPVVAAPKSTVRTTVYFLADDGAAPVGVRRTIERKSPYGREALRALLAGPTRAERKRGLTTGLPPGTRLLSLTLEARVATVAIVDLAGLPPAQGRLGVAATLGMRLRVVTQLARTLIGLSGIERVEVRVDGRPWDLWTMDGRILRTATGYERLRGWTRACGERSAEERELHLSRCFSALP